MFKSKPQTSSLKPMIFFPIPWLLCLYNGSLLTEARLALNWYGWQWPSNLPASTCCMPGLQHINMPGLCGAGIKLRPSSTLVKFSTNKATPPPQFHICKGPITIAVVGVHFHTQMPYRRGKFIAYPPWSNWHQHEWHHHHHQGLQKFASGLIKERTLT